MSRAYEELEVCQSVLGRLILRRRRPPGLEVDVFEIMLGDDLLMSSYLTESERQLAQLGLDAVEGTRFPVLVGGLGLGYTVAAALGDARVASLRVIELLPEIIAWHERGLVPLGASLRADPRVTIAQGDFFSVVGGGSDAHPKEGYGAILVDIDHAPDAWLDDAHGRFYGQGGLARAAALLAPGGVLAYWSAGAPHAAFLGLLGAVFDEVTTHAVEVYNPMIDEDQLDTIYVARLGEAGAGGGPS